MADRERLSCQRRRLGRHPRSLRARTSDSGDRGSDDRSGSSEGASVDGSHSSDSSRVSIREDASRRLSGFWERESEEDSRFRGSWQRREDRGPRASKEESSCCSSSDPCVGASEDRRSSRGLGSTPPQSPSPRAKDRTMPGVANSGPSKSSREAADSCESFVVIPCLGHNTFPTSGTSASALAGMFMHPFPFIFNNCLYSII